MSPLLVAPCRELPVAPSTDAILQPVFGVPDAQRAKIRLPINLSLEIFGDRWSLIVIRDMCSATAGTSVNSFRLSQKNFLLCLSECSLLNKITKQEFSPSLLVGKLMCLPDLWFGSD
jgi:hypothetical protein